jgi:hypothetical protein
MPVKISPREYQVCFMQGFNGFRKNYKITRSTDISFMEDINPYILDSAFFRAWEEGAYESRSEILDEIEYSEKLARFERYAS